MVSKTHKADKQWFYIAANEKYSTGFCYLSDNLFTINIFKLTLSLYDRLLLFHVPFNFFKYLIFYYFFLLHRSDLDQVISSHEYVFIKTDSIGNTWEQKRGRGRSGE